MAAEGRGNRAGGTGGMPLWNAPNQPVVGVSYWEAEAFAKWAGEDCYPRRGNGKPQREARPGMSTRGTVRGRTGSATAMRRSLGSTSAVGIFPRSRSVDFGLEDMAGNVWEWCQDVVERIERLGPGVPGRELERRGRVLPVGVPLRGLAGVPEHDLGFRVARSLSGK